jgi:hypothetical protein
MKNENDFVAAISTKLSLRTPGGVIRFDERSNPEPAGLAQTDFLSWAVFFGGPAAFAGWWTW